MRTLAWSASEKVLAHDAYAPFSSQGALEPEVRQAIRESMAWFLLVLAEERRMDPAEAERVVAFVDWKVHAVIPLDRVEEAVRAAGAGALSEAIDSLLTDELWVADARVMGTLVRTSLQFIEDLVDAMRQVRTKSSGRVRLSQRVWFDGTRGELILADGGSNPLSLREVTILRRLARADGVPVHWLEIGRAMKPGALIADCHTTYQAISRLRRTLAGVGAAGNLVCQSGRGYQLVPWGPPTPTDEQTNI